MTSTISPSTTSSSDAPATPPARHVIGRVLGTPFTVRAWRELGYVVVACVTGGLGLSYVAFVVLTAPWLALLVVGLPLVGAAVLGARLAGAAQRALMAAIVDVDVPAPAPFRSRPGVLGFVGSALTDGPGWKAMAFLLVRSPFVVVGGYLVGSAVAIGVFAVAYPAFWVVVEPTNVDAAGRERHSGLQLGEWYADTWARALMIAAAGVVVLLVVPWLVRGLVVIDVWLGRALLGPSASDAEVAHLSRTRADAVVRADEQLRRIERDLHDGAQARMAAIALGLGQVQEDLDGDAPLDRDRLRRLVGTSHGHSLTAIEELRDLARGIRPPVLDMGLGPALAELAATSPVPIELRLPAVDRRHPPETEAIVWFCASEAVANVIRHSGATRAVLELRQLDTVLRLQVVDDGRGGASAAPGSGLSGLADRVAPVDGRVEVTSPVGGPTTVTVDVPVGHDRAVEDHRG